VNPALPDNAAQPSRAVPSSASETARRVAEWNRTALEFDGDGSIHQAIAASAHRFPQRPAIIFHDRVLTYDELDQRAEQLAGYLRSRGVGTETPVGICLDRSPAMVIAMIAALKAGGAYLPLDPAFPADRVAFMVADSAARAIVTQAGLRNRFAETQATVIDLEADADAIPQTGLRHRSGAARVSPI